MGEAHLIHGSSGAFKFLEQEEELERIYSNACAQYGAITHDAFLALLVSFQRCHAFEHCTHAQLRAWSVSLTPIHSILLSVSD